MAKTKMIFVFIKWSGLFLCCCLRIAQTATFFADRMKKGMVQKQCGFWLAVTALLFWSGSDLFSKIGCRGNDKYAHLKMVIAVGVVMGVHAMYEIFVGGTIVTWHVILTYLPVSLLYIFSMTLGYIGLRYIELSISSPICNSSGALVAVLCFSDRHTGREH